MSDNNLPYEIFTNGVGIGSQENGYFESYIKTKAVNDRIKNFHSTIENQAATITHLREDATRQENKLLNSDLANTDYRTELKERNTEITQLKNTIADHEGRIRLAYTALSLANNQLTFRIAPGPQPATKHSEFEIAMGVTDQQPEWKPTSYWTNHPTHTPRTWINDINNNETRQSYTEWVNTEIVKEANL